ncbi:MAG TPA: response regulator [Isosphaeraceae bacterium]|jgi:DNA-binding response OmpR family regulator|nr:response regulator [Isosphaeraceae bacterium]
MPTALIVEDEPEANHLLSMLVQLRGYRADSALTGAEALELAGRRPPDVAFLDVMLPDLNGFEVCRALKTRRATSPAPVVMVTARLSPDNRLECLRAGAEGYIPKPYMPDQIFEALDAAAASRRALQAEPDVGTFPLDVGDEPASLARVGRLWTLALARTRCEEPVARNLAQALADIALAAASWGRRQGRDPVATISYRLEPDRLTLSIRDRSGWFSLGSPPRGLLGPLIDRVGFDRFTDGDDEITLVRRVGRSGVGSGP